MINNRQGGRRRGRGGQRGQNVGGQPGNRQDSRQRGNAAQLLEKYKNMARDSQLAGDRVQTEYYLQFADHYYRVLGENRPRSEDQRGNRDDDLDDDEGDDEMMNAGDQSSGGDERQDQPERNDRSDRNERPERQARERPRRRFERDERGSEDQSDQQPAHVNGADGSIPLDVLPPAIGADAGEPGSDEEAAPRPRRRARSARPADGDNEVAPAA